MSENPIKRLTPEELEAAATAFAEQYGGVAGLLELLRLQQVKALHAEGCREEQMSARIHAAARGRTQCNAKTQAGDRCKRAAAPNRTQCIQHRGTSVRFKKADRARCRLLGRL